MVKQGKVKGALDGLVKPHGGKRGRAVARAPAVPMQQPTDEQLARSEFVRGEIRDEGRYIGLAYRRRPLVESLADKIGLSSNDLAALRYYRTAFERADASPTKSCLDVGAGGGGGNGTESRSLAAIERAVAAKAIVGRCERAIGAVADTMRAVAVFDQSFSDVAIGRFGGRDQSWFVDEGGKKVHRTKVVPRSGRHREIVASEFMKGTKSLVRLLSGYRPMVGSGDLRDPMEAQGARATVSASISLSVALNPNAAAIWMAETTMWDVRREAALGDDAPEEFCGIPIVIRSDWTWGWMLVAGEEGSCAGATDQA